MNPKGNDSSAQSVFGPAAAVLELAVAGRWRSPESTAALADHASSRACAEGDVATRLLAEGWLLHGLLAAGRGAGAVPRAVGALADAARVGHRPAEARLRLGLAAAARELGDPASARALLLPVLRDRLADPELAADAHLEAVRGGTVGTADDPLAAVDEAAECIRGLRGEQVEFGLAALDLSLAHRHRAAGRGRAAAARAGEGLRRLLGNREGGAELDPVSPHLAAWLTHELTIALLDGDQPELAPRAAEPALAWAGRPSALVPLTRLRLALARRVYLPAGEHEAAARAVGWAAEAVTEQDLPQVEADCQSLLAEVHELRGTLPEALAASRRAQHAMRRHGRRVEQALVLLGRHVGCSRSTGPLPGPPPLASRVPAGSVVPRPPETIPAGERRPDSWAGAGRRTGSTQSLPPVRPVPGEPAVSWPLESWPGTAAPVALGAVDREQDRPFHPAMSAGLAEAAGGLIGARTPDDEWERSTPDDGIGAAAPGRPPGLGEPVGLAERAERGVAASGRGEFGTDDGPAQVDVPGVEPGSPPAPVERDELDELIDPGEVRPLGLLAIEVATPTGRLTGASAAPLLARVAEHLREQLPPRSRLRVLDRDVVLAVLPPVEPAVVVRWMRSLSSGLTARWAEYAAEVPRSAFRVAVGTVDTTTHDLRASVDELCARLDAVPLQPGTAPGQPSPGGRHVAVGRTRRSDRSVQLQTGATAPGSGGRRRRPDDGRGPIANGGPITNGAGITNGGPGGDPATDGGPIANGSAKRGRAVDRVSLARLPRMSATSADGSPDGDGHPGSAPTNGGRVGGPNPPWDLRADALPTMALAPGSARPVGAGDRRGDFPGDTTSVVGDDLLVRDGAATTGSGAAGGSVTPTSDHPLTTRDPLATHNSVTTRDPGTTHDSGTTGETAAAGRAGPPPDSRTVSELTFAELLAGALAAYRDT